MASYPLDYVFAGAQVIYSANVNSVPYYSGALPDDWRARFGYLQQIAASHYRVNASEGNAIAGSIFFNLTVASDMRSINDITATMDGAVRTAGFQLRASMTRFLSNPRRDGTTQPPVNTPGVPPPVTTLPPQAGNVDTRGWQGFNIGGTLNDLAGKLGLNSTTLLLVGGALVLVLVIGKR